MMEVLVGNKLHDAAHKPVSLHLVYSYLWNSSIICTQIADFFEAISTSYQAPFTKIDDASKILDQTLAKVT